MESERSCHKCSNTKIMFKRVNKKVIQKACTVCLIKTQQKTNKIKPSIRPFKFPIDWKPEGPNPAFTIYEAEKLLEQGEMITSLCGYWSIFQFVDGHRYTTDDVAGASVCIRHLIDMKIFPKNHLDLGTGLGSLEHSVGIEAQEKNFKLATKTLQTNIPQQSKNNNKTVEIFHADLREIKSLKNIETKLFDLITGTPPYFSKLKCLPADEGRSMCAFEFRGGVEEYCIAANLKFDFGNEKSRFIFVQTALEIGRSERAVWGLAKMRILKRVDFFGKVGRNSALFCVFICSPPPSLLDNDYQNEKYEVEDVFVRNADGGYTEVYECLMVMLGKPKPKK